jgi:hypothetical protein
MHLAYPSTQQVTAHTTGQLFLNLHRMQNIFKTIIFENYSFGPTFDLSRKQQDQ